MTTVLLLGATGRTGQLIAAQLLARGHALSAVVRDPARLDDQVRASARLTVGSSTDAKALTESIVDCSAVVSALGPGRGETTLHRETAAALIPVMASAGVARFVGVSGSAVPTPRDSHARSFRAISAVVRRVGGEISRDKRLEYQAFCASDLDWTLVRPPRLVDGPATGQVSHGLAAPARWHVRRSDLATFVVEVLEGHLYSRQAPFVSAA